NRDRADARRPRDRRRGSPAATSRRAHGDWRQTRSLRAPWDPWRAHRWRDRGFKKGGCQRECDYDVEGRSLRPTKVVAPAAPLHATRASAGIARAIAPSTSIQAVRDGLALEGAELAPPRGREGAQVGAGLDRLTHPGVAGEDVDGKPVGDVLVRRLLPGEAVPMQRDDVLQQGER